MNLSPYLASVVLPVILVVSSPALSADDGLPLGRDITLSTGYRSDQTAWSIGADSGPDTISELQWTDLQIAEITLDAKFEFTLPLVPRKFVLLPEFGYGQILSGRNQDSDYARDGRGGEFSRSVADTDGYVLDASIGMGHRFTVPGTKLKLTPAVGYSYHKQSLKDTNGRQLIDRPDLEAELDGEDLDENVDPELGAFSGLASRYSNLWHGAWIGLEAEMPLSSRIRLEANARYHWVDLRGDAHWNLRDLNFENRASGSGLSISAALAWTLRENIDLNVGAHWTSFETGSGSQSDPDGSIPLNEVTWESWGVRIGATIRF